MAEKKGDKNTAKINYIKKGDSALEKSEFDDAAEYYEKAGHKEGLIKIGDKILKGEDFWDAAEYYEKAGHKEGLIKLGDKASKGRDFSSAAEYYEKAGEDNQAEKAWVEAGDEIIGEYKKRFKELHNRKLTGKRKYLAEYGSSILEMDGTTIRKALDYYEKAFDVVKDENETELVKEKMKVVERILGKTRSQLKSEDEERDAYQKWKSDRDVREGHGSISDDVL